MRDEQEPRTDRPAEGDDPSIADTQTAHEAGEFEEQLVAADFDLESNELRASGQTCARCGRAFQPGEDVRRTLSGAYQHDFCPPG
jgi:hypothetical protein